MCRLISYLSYRLYKNKLEGIHNNVLIMSNNWQFISFRGASKTYAASMLRSSVDIRTIRYFIRTLANVFLGHSLRVHRCWIVGCCTHLGRYHKYCKLYKLQLSIFIGTY